MVGILWAWLVLMCAVVYQCVMVLYDGVFYTGSDAKTHIGTDAATDSKGTCIS